jgi:bacterioferritin-associated ferredoxin
VIICHCERVSDAVVHAAIACGADTVTDVTVRCRAGGRCGSCVSTIESLLATVADEMASETQSAA